MRGVDMSLMHQLRTKLADEQGFTLVELMVGFALSAVLMGSLGAFLISTLNAGAFAEGHSATMNNARTVIQRLEKEARGAEALSWCEPIGFCLEVGGQTPTGNFRTVRYSKSGTELLRQEYDGTSMAWSAGIVELERVANDGSTPVFSCETQSTLLRLNIDLRVQPTPGSDPQLQVTTSIRPRNFQSAANCP
jgi:prepilin-type N-terminal cleavage/methylation domain-containing protein